MSNLQGNVSELNWKEEEFREKISSAADVKFQFPYSEVTTIKGFPPKVLIGNL